MFRFLKIGYNIFYGFFLTLLAAILFSPSIVRATVQTSEMLSFIFLPLMLILYYILLACVMFFFVSILAGIGMLIKTMLHKKLNYQQVWTITINALTWPTLLIAAASLLFPLPTAVIWIYLIGCLIMLANALQAIPKPKPRPLPTAKQPDKKPID
ncbi:DUF1189 family protein [Camelliibacillus cellulosilyticus]|uniref:DUF1189 family protein n=1 Tax=Camelliibacillus cellulosilyticus TaxID=2174486 RepID=A0ABV9GMW6_9BACL